MHAITEMTRQLRQGKGRHGLILANGGVMTYQHVLCLSSVPRRNGLPYPDQNPLPEYVTDIAAPKVVERVEGEQDAIIEVRHRCRLDVRSINSTQTYTVEFNRDNTPLRAYIVARLKNSGHRFVANHGDNGTLTQMSWGEGEKIGRVGRVRNDGERNLFVLKQETLGKL